MKKNDENISNELFLVSTQFLELMKKFKIENCSIENIILDEATNQEYKIVVKKVSKKSLFRRIFDWQITF